MANQPSPAFQPLAALRSKYALNWRTHLIFAIPAASSGFLNDYTRLGGSPTYWTITLLAAYFITVLGIEMGLSLRERLALKPAIWSSLLILICAGLLRGLVIYLLGSWLGIVPASDWAYRLFSAPIYIVTTYIIFNALVTSLIQQRDAEQKLRNESRNLSHSRELFAKELERLRLERAAKVRDLIAPSLWEISKRLGDAKLKGKTEELVQALRETNDRVVRPLSKNMLTNFELPTIAAIPALSRIGRLTLPKRIKLGNSVSVLFLVLVSLAMGYSTQVLNAGFTQALVNIFVAGIYFGAIGYLLKYATARIEHSTWLGLLLSIPLGFAVGMSVEVILRTPGVLFREDFPAQAGVFFAIAYPSSYIIAATNAQRMIVLQQLEAVVTDLKVLNSQLRQQVWLDQKLLATELHGSVQATLHAAALTLSKKESPSAKDLDKTLESVQKVVDGLGDAAYLEGNSFEQVLTDIADVWEGVCEISYSLAPEAISAINDDPKAARSVIEVVRETITNAIKHNSAKSVAVSLTISGKLLELQISNPGVLAVAKELGAGSEIMAELTYRYELSQVGELVELKAVIPLSLEGAA